MKTYTWVDRIGFSYSVLADSVAEAKDFLRRHYYEADLDAYLFVRKPKITKMPKALCNLNPAQAVLLYANKGKQ